VQLVEPLVQRVMESLAEYGCSERQSIAAELALREALANAMLHGNGGDPKKRVEVACMRHEDGSITLMVRDEGAGFPLDAVRDPTDPQNLYRPGGRGIYLIRHFMDDVEFRRNGAEIRMYKRKE
jgi:serine/threonine-protein kinase RsbW